MRVRSGIAAVALALLSIAMAKDAATIHSLRLDGVLVRRQSSRPGPVTNQPVSRPSNSQQSEPKVAPKPKPNPKTKANPNVNSRVPQQKNQPKGKIEPNAGGGKAGRPQGIPAQQLNNQRVGQQNPKFKGGGGSVPKQNKGGLPQPNPGDIRQNDNTRQKQQGRQNQQSGQNQQELRKKKKQGKQDQQNQEEQQEQQDQQEQQNQNEQNANDKQSGNDQQSQNNVETKKFKIGNVRAVFQVPINEIQTGKEGLEGQDAKPGQTTSEQSNINFFDACVGKNVMDGQQQKEDQTSCNTTPMGEVPAVSNMPTVSITSPQMCEDIQEGEAFKVVANYKNIALGSFTDPKSTFYDAPTRLTEQGEVIGHTHIACQLMSANSFNPENPPDAEKPDFFKGIDDPGETENGITTVEATVEAGELAQGAGCYRCCTMTGGANHQALGMPIAQRGTQDSCTFFSVGGANCGCSAQGGGQQGGGGQQEVKGGGGKGGGGKVQDGKGKGGKAPVQVGGKKVVKQIVKSGRQR